MMNKLHVFDFIRVSGFPFLFSVLTYFYINAFMIHIVPMWEKSEYTPIIVLSILLIAVGLIASLSIYFAKTPNSANALHAIKVLAMSCCFGWAFASWAILLLS